MHLKQLSVSGLKNLLSLVPRKGRDLLISLFFSKTFSANLESFQPYATWW